MLEVQIIFTVFIIVYYVSVYGLYIAAIHFLRFGDGFEIIGKGVVHTCYIVFFSRVCPVKHISLLFLVP